MGWTRATVVNVAKRTGYPVIEAWSGNDQGQMGTIYGPMMHHTGSANPTNSDYPTLKIVRDGRSDLLNSLCMYGIGKSGTIYCISEKVSWHAGAGSWNGVTDGNGHFAGIEAESSGNGTDWTGEQLDSYQRLCASILLEANRDISWLVAHKEWALPKGRKVDTAGIDLVGFRKNVSGLLANPGSINKITGIGGVDDDMTPDEFFNAPLFTDNPGTPQARVVRVRDFFLELRNAPADTGRRVWSYQIDRPGEPGLMAAGDLLGWTDNGVSKVYAAIDALAAKEQQVAPAAAAPAAAVDAVAVAQALAADQNFIDAIAAATAKNLAQRMES